MTVSPGWGSFPEANWMIFWDVCKNWDTPVQGFRPPGHCKPRTTWSATEASQARPLPVPILGPARIRLSVCSGRHRCEMAGAGMGAIGRDSKPLATACHSLVALLLFPGRHLRQGCRGLAGRCLVHTTTRLGGATTAGGTGVLSHGHSRRCSQHHLGLATNPLGRGQWTWPSWGPGTLRPPSGHLGGAS